MVKHIFVINKNIKVRNLENIISMACRGMNLDFLILNTDSIDDMKEQIKSYKNTEAIIYACGGDGSLNVLLNEILGSKAMLGIIPIGTGNDFYRSLNEYYSEIIDVNVMNVNGNYGFNIFSLGIDAEICANVEKLKKLPIPNKYLYDISMFYTFFKYRNQVMGINNFFEKLMLLAVCNGAYYGGGKKIALQANIHTKDVFILTVGDMPKINMPLFGLELKNRCHEDNPYVDLFLTDKDIHIETMYPLNGQLDGEIIKGNEFNIIPNAGEIRVVNNRKLIRRILNKNQEQKI